MLPTFNNKGDVLMLEHFTTHLRTITVGELRYTRKTVK